MSSKNAKGEQQRSNEGWFVASLVHRREQLFSAVVIAQLDHKKTYSVFSRKLLTTPSKAIHWECNCCISTNM